jgi:hypothetical protein
MMIWHGIVFKLLLTYADQFLRLPFQICSFYESMVDEFLVGFKNGFNLDIIPKMHHLVQYSIIIRHIGTHRSY